MEVHHHPRIEKKSFKEKAADIDAKIFNSRYLKYSNIEDPLRSDLSILPGAKLINDDAKLLAEYANRRQGIQFVLSNYLIHLNIAGNAAQNLIKLIKAKRYKIAKCMLSSFPKF